MYELEEVFRKLIKYKMVRVDYIQLEHELSHYLDYKDIKYSIEYKEAHSIFRLEE